MKNTVKNIKEFLKSNDVEWNELLFDKNNSVYRQARDEDFAEQKIETLRLRNVSGEELTKQVLITEDLFLVFRGHGQKLEADVSRGWKNYLSKTPEAEQKRNETFRRIARQDARLAVREDDGMPQRIKKTVFDNEKLDKVVKDAIEKSVDEEENKNI